MSADDGGTPGPLEPMAPVTAQPRLGAGGSQTAASRSGTHGARVQAPVQPGPAAARGPAPINVAWRHSLGAGLLLGLALGCAWVARWAPHWIARLGWLVLASALALLGLGLLLAASEQWDWLQGWRRRWGATGSAEAAEGDGGAGSASFPFFLTMALLALAAVTSGNNLLYLILSGLIAAALLSGATAAMNLSGLELHFQTPPEIFAGQPASMEFQLTNTKGFWPAYSLTVSAHCEGGGVMRPVYFAYLPRRAGAASAGTMTFPRRGRFGGAAFVCATRFPFGLMPKRRRFQASGEEPGMLVYPAPTAGLALPRQLQKPGAERAGDRRGEGQELYRIRGHQPSDSARLLDWKASARAGSLHVREYLDESAVRVGLRLALMPDLAPEAAERAISLCAGWAETLAAAGVWVEFWGEHPRPNGEGLHLAAAPARLQRRAILAYLAECDGARWVGCAARASQAPAFEIAVRGSARAAV